MTALSILALSIWRVRDGGLLRPEMGSTLMGYALCVLFAAWSIEVPWLALLVGLCAGRALTSGYEDFDDIEAMAIKTWPFVVATLALLLADVMDIRPGGCRALPACALVMLAFVNGPYVRARLKKRGHWANRAAEAMEGAGVGLALAVV